MPALRLNHIHIQLILPPKSEPVSIVGTKTLCQKKFILGEDIKLSFLLALLLNLDSETLNIVTCNQVLNIHSAVKVGKEEHYLEISLHDVSSS